METLAVVSSSRKKRTAAKHLCVTNVTELLLACSVAIFTKYQCFLVFYKKEWWGLRQFIFQTKLLSRLSHKLCRLLSSPVRLRKFTIDVTIDGLQRLLGFSLITMMIIENRALWLARSFVLSRYNHRAVIITLKASSFQNGSQIFWCFGVGNWSILSVFSRIIINVIILTSTSSRWLFADIHFAFGD